MGFEKGGAMDFGNHYRGLRNLKSLGGMMSSREPDLHFAYSIVRNPEEAELLADALGVRVFRGQAQVDLLCIPFDEARVRFLLED
jgi:hypothetical protein